jgi:hypothetical protein
VGELSTNIEPTAVDHTVTCTLPKPLLTCALLGAAKTWGGFVRLAGVGRLCTRSFSNLSSLVVQFKDGLLEIHVPKHPDEVDHKPELKKIDIKVGDDR